MVSPPGPQPGASASSATSARKRKKYSSVPSFVSRLKYGRLPFLRPIAAAYDRRPRLVAFLLMTVAMVLMMTVFSWQTGLEFRQWIALAVATVVLAWLCVLVAFLEEEE